MIRVPGLPASHDRFAVLALGRRVAAELAAEALDPEAPLAMADRVALATLSHAVEAEAARRAGVESLTAEAIPALAAALARVEREAALPIPPAPAVGLRTEAIAMHTAELIRWAAVAAFTAAAIRFQRPTVFWSLGARRPFVLARVRSDSPSRFRSASA